MRILAVHRYFWPDTPPYASILRSIAESWSDLGHEVHVLSSQPSYKSETFISKKPELEYLNGLQIRRLNIPPEKRLKGISRLINILRFSASVFFYILSKKPYDLIMASTAPPVLLSAAASLGAKLTKANFIYHCMDIQPEIGKISGEFKHKCLFNFLRLIDTLVCKSSCRIVVLSSDMKKSLYDRKRCKNISVEIINNFNFQDYEDTVESLPTGLSKKKGVFRVLFAGNIGRFQGLEAFVEAMRYFRERQDIELVFLGEGAAKNKLVEICRNYSLQNIKFYGHRPLSVAKQIIKSSDLCLVSLAAGVERYAYPSKTATYLSLGCPLLVRVGRNCELTKLVEENGIGEVVLGDDAVKIAHAILSIANDEKRLEKMKKNVARTAAKFAEERMLKRWTQLINCIENRHL